MVRAAYSGEAREKSIVFQYSNQPLSSRAIGLWSVYSVDQSEGRTDGLTLLTSMNFETGAPLISAQAYAGGISQMTSQMPSALGTLPNPTAVVRMDLQ